MARNKHPEVTIDKILQVSFNLFIDKGYEKTTIKDIVNNLNGLSRGAIYHHFKSKSDILEAVAKKLFNTDDLISIQNSIDINGFNKLKRVAILSITNYSYKNYWLKAEALKKSPYLLAKIIDISTNQSSLVVEDIINKGVEDGSLQVINIKEVSEILMLLINIWVNPILTADTKESFTNKIIFIKKLLDSLGLPIIDSDVMIEVKRFRDNIFA